MAPKRERSSAPKLPAVSDVDVSVAGAEPELDEDMKAILDKVT